METVGHCAIDCAAEQRIKNKKLSRFSVIVYRKTSDRNKLPALKINNNCP
jgi:hypothetical protein